MGGRPSGLQRLSGSDLVRAFRAACASGHMPNTATPSRSAADRACRDVDALIVELGTGGAAGRLPIETAVAAAVTVLVCSDVVDPVVPGAQAATYRYLFHAAHAYAAAHGLELSVDADTWTAHVQVADVTPQARQAFRQFVQHALTGASGNAENANAPNEALFNAFIAMPVTDQSEEALRESQDMGRLAAVAALDFGASLEHGQPAFRLDSKRSAVAVATLDHDGLVVADVVIVLVPSSACGLGVVVNVSAHAGALVLVLAPRGSLLSPLVVGHSGDVDIVNYGQPSDVEQLVRDYLRRRGDQAQAQQDHRKGRPARWAAALAAVRLHVQHNGPVGASRTWPETLVSQSLRSVDHFAAAATDMTEDLLHAATGAGTVSCDGRGLTEREIEALDEYRVAAGLTCRQHVRLLAAGSELLSSGKSRVELDQQTWAALQKGLNR